MHAVSLANSGFGARSPQISIPISLAGAMGFWPDLPASTVSRTYSTPAGPFSAHLIPGAVDVTLRTPDRAEGPIRADVQINPHKAYPLANDHLVQALGVVLLRPADGVWAFADDLHNPRQGEPAPEP